MSARPQPLHHHSFAEFLAVEDVSRVKHEFLAGEIYAMAGGTPEHAAVAGALIASLGAQLRGGPCRVYSSDLRVRIRETGLATYPDVSVVRGPTERDPESATHVTNPRVVIEVTSDGTEDFDRGEKLDHYRTVSSIEAVVLVSHRKREIQVWSRGAEGWGSETYASGGIAPLPWIGSELAVDAIYDAASENR